MTKNKLQFHALIFIIIPAIVTLSLASPKTDNFLIKGYLKFLHSVYIPSDSDLWLTANLLHNRIDASWLPSDMFSLVAGLRSRFAYGDFVKFDPLYGKSIRQAGEYFKLSTTVIKDNSYILHTGFDRLYANFSVDNWNIKLGRHRINWGMNLVWNPNDWFNTFSYLDFDYEERPGTDGISVQYYTSSTSSMDAAVKIHDEVDSLVVAGRYMFNRNGYDIQFLGGLVEGDIALGAGWSGQIRGAAFRGEISYFQPRSNAFDTIGMVIASVSTDYTFSNQLFIQVSTLANSDGTKKKAGAEQQTGSASAKYLTQALLELFAQVSYPFNPLVQGSAAAIVNAFDGSGVFNPSLSVSLTENIDLSVTAQAFWGGEKTEYGEKGTLLFGRLKWSF